MLSPGSLQLLAGPLEVKFKGGAFSTWSDSFVRLEGRWLCVYKRERDSLRQGAIELGLGVSVTDTTNRNASPECLRQFHLTCEGGLLPKTEISFRIKSQKDRDVWVQAVLTNLQCLTSSRGLDPRYGVLELAPITKKMRHDLILHPIRISSDMTVKCATGEAIVTFFLNQGLVPDRATGALLCRQLLSMNLLHHVMWDRDFTDSPEPFVIAVIDGDDDCRSDREGNYHVAHFLKYMDSRKFWRYTAGPSDAVDVSSSSAASSNRRAALSSASLDQSANSSGNERNLGISKESEHEGRRFLGKSVFASISPTSDDGVIKKVKKCAVCSKSFNPLRRRRHCLQCRAVICSSCSVLRNVINSDGESAGNVAPSWRVCISCKLSSNASLMSESNDVVDSNIQLQDSKSASDVLTSTSSTSDVIRANGRDGSSQESSFCHHCRNEKCSPITDFQQINYPVNVSTDATLVTARQFANEADRLKSVETLLVTMAATPSATRVLRQLCSMAAIACQCSVAFVGLLDNDNYVLGSQHGINLNATVPRKHAMAAHTCRSGVALVCSDITQDVRFKGNTWRQEYLKNAVFYAGIPLILSNGHVVGAVEVFDVQPRYECGEVLSQLEIVVNGLLNLLEEIMTAATEAQQDDVFGQAKQVPVEKQTEEVKHKNAAASAANPMEAQLLQLLSQTTTTQEQLRSQQGQMVSAISSHSKQIDCLAKQLERIEATLATKL